MKSSVAILGSTGSIGVSTLSVLSRSRKYKIKLLTTNKNANKILKQASKFKVKNVIITNKNPTLSTNQYLKKNKFIL